MKKEITEMTQQELLDEYRRVKNLKYRTPAQRKIDYQNKWAKEHKKQINLKFDKVKDAEVIDFLKRTGNATDYVRQQVIFDMAWSEIPFKQVAQVVDGKTFDMKTHEELLQEEVNRLKDELKEANEAYEILFKGYEELKEAQ